MHNARVCRRARAHHWFGEYREEDAFAMPSVRRRFSLSKAMVVRDHARSQDNGNAAVCTCACLWNNWDSTVKVCARQPARRWDEVNERGRFGDSHKLDVRSSAAAAVAVAVTVSSSRFYNLAFVRKHIEVLFRTQSQNFAMLAFSSRKKIKHSWRGAHGPHEEWIGTERDELSRNADISIIEYYFTQKSTYRD